MVTAGQMYKAEKAYKTVVDSIRAVELIANSLPPHSVDRQFYQEQLSNLMDLKRFIEERMVT